MPLDDFKPEVSEVSEAVTSINQPLPEAKPIEAQVATPVGEVFETAFELHNPVNNLFQLGEKPYEPIERWDALAHPELLEGIDEQYHKEIVAARSYEHASRIRTEIQEEVAGNEMLIQEGFTGLGAIAVASLASPDIFLGGGAIYNTGKLALKAHRLQRVGIIGAEGFALGAVSTAAQAANQHTVDAEDVLYNGLFGMALIGGTDTILQSFKGVNLADEAADILNRTRNSMDSKLAEPKDLSAAATARGDSRFSKTETEEDIVADASEWAETNKVTRGGQVSQVMDAIAKKFPSMASTDSTNLWNSKSAVANKFTHEMAESGSGIYKRTDTAAQIKDFTERRYLSKFMPNYEAHVQGFAGAAGLTGRRAKADAFNRELRLELEGRRRAFIEGAQPTKNVDPVITKAADEWQSMVDDVLNDAKSTQVQGFDAIERIPGYVPLHWDGAALRGMSKIDYNGYLSLLAKGYEETGMDEDVAMKIAEAVLDRSGRKDLGLDSNVSALFSGDAAAALKRLLGDEQFEQVQNIVKGKSDEAGASARARKRTDVDLTVTDASGRSLLDIVNNDMQFVGSKYSQEMAGRVAMAKKGIKSEADFDRIKEAALKQASELGEDTDLIDRSMQSVYNQLLSRPADGQGVHKGLRRFMDFASVSMLGGMGMAQLAEYGPILAQVGIQDTMKNLKFLSPKNFARDFEGEVLQDMQSLMGKVGQEEILYAPYVRLEDAGDATTNKLLKGYDDISARAQYLNGMLSGNNAIKRHQQRMAVTLGAAKVARLVKEGKFDTKFLEEIGMEQATLKEIQKRIDSGDVTFNANGGLDGLNLASWNPKAAENFAVSMNRHMHQVVQRTLAGENSYWMDGNLAKLFLQFRNYPVAAMGKQLARGIRSGNAGPVFLYSTASAILAYNLKLTLQNKDTSNLSVEDHVLNVMQMSSPAGLLPDMYSTTMGMMGQDNTFGRQADVSNPVFSLLEAGYNAPQAVYNLANGEGSKGDVSTITTLSPFSNIGGVSALVNGLKEGM